MNASYKLHKAHYKKAKETLDLLLLHRAEIDLKLESNFSSATLHKDLRTVNMDIRITENEMEHAQFRIREYESRYNSSEAT
jgi:hypothetical protein